MSLQFQGLQSKPENDGGWAERVGRASHLQGVPLLVLFGAGVMWHRGLTQRWGQMASLEHPIKTLLATRLTQPGPSRWWQSVQNGHKEHGMAVTTLKTLTDTAAAGKLLQLCLTLCDPIDGSPPGSPVPGILQARTLSGLPFPSPMHACMLSRFSHVRLCATPWTAHQALLSMEFSKQEYWSGLPFPSPLIGTRQVAKTKGLSHAEDVTSTV